MGNSNHNNNKCNCNTVMTKYARNEAKVFGWRRTGRTGRMSVSKSTDTIVFPQTLYCQLLNMPTVAHEHKHNTSEWNIKTHTYTHMYICMYI